MTGRARPARFFQSLRVHARVVSALVIREALAKYGHENLGFFWVMGEPLLLSACVMALWKVGAHGHANEIGLVPFILSGYCCLSLWRHIITRSMHALGARSGLFYHANVTYLDVLVSIALLETLGIFTGFWIAYVPLATFGQVYMIRDPLPAILGWLLLGWFTFGVALVLAALGEMFETVEKFVQPILYATIPLTGAYTLLDWLPERAQRFLSYSPLVNCLEMFRAPFFPEDVRTIYDVSYTVLCCCVITVIGLPLMGYAQKHVTSNG